MDHNQLNSGLVDQVFMGYGSLGMCALASSFQDPNLQRQWEQDLIHYARLQPFGAVDPPPCAYTYVTFGDSRAAILRRVREGNSLGRNNGHALVGPAAFLGPRALQLTRTFTWAVRPEEMSQKPYLISQLRDLDPRPGGVALCDNEGDSDRWLCSALRIMGCVLDNPRLNVSFIGLDHNLIIPTLELFEAVIGPLFAVDPPIRNWSFSTYEVTDADLGGSIRLPELIFLPVLPSHAGETYHHRLFLDEDAGVDDRYHQLATRLVEQCRELGRDDYSRTMKGELSSKETVESRIRYLLNGGSQGPRGHHSIQEVLDQAPQESPQNDSWSESRQWSPAIPTSTPRVAPTFPSTPSQILQPSRPIEKPAGHVSRTALNDDELVLQLTKSITWSQVDMNIHLLREHGCTIPDKHRWHLISRPEVLNVLVRTFPPWELNTAYTQLLEFAFGADAKALRQPEYFNWVKGHLGKPDTNYFFGQTIFSLVEGSSVATECHNLLRERWRQVPSIPLMAPDDTDLPYVRHRVSDFLALCRNRQLLIVAILIILMGIITVTIIFT